MKVVARVKEPMICDKGLIFHEFVVLKPGFQFDVVFGLLDVNLCLEKTTVAISACSQVKTSVGGSDVEPKAHSTIVQSISYIW